MKSKNNIFKYLLIFFFILLCSGTFLGLLQLWANTFPNETFLKIVFTFIILLSLNIIALVILHQFLEERRLKEDQFID